MDNDTTPLSSPTLSTNATTEVLDPLDAPQPVTEARARIRTSGETLGIVSFALALAGVISSFSFVLLGAALWIGILAVRRSEPGHRAFGLTGLWVSAVSLAGQVLIGIGILGTGLFALAVGAL